VIRDAPFAVDAHEPLSPWLGPRPAPAADVRALRLEFSSRGDRVPARLLLPARPAGRLPLLLTQHGAGGHKDAPTMDAVSLPWARRGAAVLTLDFPLHGERSSAKLGERLVLALRGETLADSAAAALVGEFVRQAVVDLRRGLAAASAACDEVDAARVAYAGFSLGAMVGAIFCAEEPRVRAAALALGGGGMGPASIDPAAHVARIAPRPLLFVGALRDERVPRARADALLGAAREPKEALWFDCGHTELPGAALKAIFAFLWKNVAGPGP